MQTTTLTELRRRISKYLDAVEEGETVRVYRHGKPIADIRPIEGDGVPAWKKPGPRLKIKGVSLSKAVIEERREARY